MRIKKELESVSFVKTCIRIKLETGNYRKASKLLIALAILASSYHSARGDVVYR